jgi:hypothetical protein
MNWPRPVLETREPAAPVRRDFPKRASAWMLCLGAVFALIGTLQLIQLHAWAAGIASFKLGWVPKTAVGVLFGRHQWLWNVPGVNPLRWSVLLAPGMLYIACAALILYRRNLGAAIAIIIVGAHFLALFDVLVGGITVVVVRGWRFRQDALWDIGAILAVMLALLACLRVLCASIDAPRRHAERGFDLVPPDASRPGAVPDGGSRVGDT